MANLHGNTRIRKLSRDIAATQAEIDSSNMEGAAKAKRNFEDRCQVEKQEICQGPGQVSCTFLVMILYLCLS
jgi:hypothetical protein